MTHKTYFKNPPIRLKGEALTELRWQCFERDAGICQRCGVYAPWDGFWVSRGHMAHVKSRGVGGSDTLDNVVWKCASCHIGLEHTKGVK